MIVPIADTTSDFGPFIAAANPAVVLALLDRLAAAEQRWIPCSERMPDDEERVLAVNHEADYVVVQLEFTDDSEGNGEPYWTTGGGNLALCNYPYWLPLPEPPKP